MGCSAFRVIMAAGYNCLCNLSKYFTIIMAGL
jgi:hypothetical protein